MSSIKVKQQGVKSVLDMYGTYQQELSSAIGLVRNVKSNRCMTGRQFRSIYSSLDRIITRLEDEKEDIRNLESGLSDVFNAYEMCENEISGQIKTEVIEKNNVEKSLSDFLKQMGKLGFYPGVFITTNSKLFDFMSDPKALMQMAGINTEEIMNVLKTNSFGSSLLDKLKELQKGKDNIEKNLSDKLKNFTDSHSKKIGSNSVYDTKTKTWTKIDPNDEKAIKEFNEAMAKSKIDTDIILATGSIGGVASFFNRSAENDWDWGSASAEATFGKVEANAQGSIGVGNIQGSIGASATAFTATEQAELGSDMLGVYAKSTQTIGRVSAKAEGSAGIIDKDGNFDPSLYVGASAEAIAGEITGEVGVKLAGADVGVKGSLNYGVGAHANIGYKDGKFSVDVGATLGVGGSVSLEIDVSGTVNAVKDHATAIWDGLTGYFGG